MGFSFRRAFTPPRAVRQPLARIFKPVEKAALLATAPVRLTLGSAVSAASPSLAARLFHLSGTEQGIIEKANSAARPFAGPAVGFIGGLFSSERQHPDDNLGLGDESQSLGQGSINPGMSPQDGILTRFLDWIGDTIGSLFA